MLPDSLTVPFPSNNTCNILSEEHVSLFIKKHSVMLSFHSISNNRNRVSNKSYIIPMVPYPSNGDNIFLKDCKRSCYTKTQTSIHTLTNL